MEKIRKEADRIKFELENLERGKLPEKPCYIAMGSLAYKKLEKYIRRWTRENIYNVRKRHKKYKNKFGVWPTKKFEILSAISDSYSLVCEEGRCVLGTAEVWVNSSPMGQVRGID